MAFQVSPGVNVSEIDLTTIVPAVSTTDGALVGAFRWGPLKDVELVQDELELASRFGKPDSNTAISFLTASSFLAYGNKLRLVRVAGTGALNSSADGSGLLVENDEHYLANFEGGAASVGPWIARHPGAAGNSLKVSLCPSQNAYSKVHASADTDVTGLILTIDSVADHTQVAEVGSKVILNSSGLERVVTAVAVGSITLNASLGASLSNVAITVEWEFKDQIQYPLGTSDYVAARSGSNDELHVIVIDEDGVFSGIPGTVLERWTLLSKASDAKKEDGSTNYYKDAINNASKYIRWTDHIPAGLNWGSPASGVTFTAVDAPVSDSLAGGAEGAAPTDADKIEGYDLFVDPETVRVDLIMGVDASAVVATHIINNICEVRKDCIALLSPEFADVVNNPNDEAEDIITFRNNLPSTSYAVLDSGWKLMFDKYNNVNRWVPLNGDVAGLCVRTDTERDPWFSPAGFNRGHIKNLIRLAYSPRKADRDDLFISGINPVVSFPGQGTVLFGDKTLLAKPSAFDAINVRRLFIVLERAISLAARFSLFEFNDEETRTQFKSLITPYLRDVQGRRGITDFRVVCDSTNNTPEVIDRNEFRGDIYIKPARAIRYIQLNFVAVRTGVDFEEIVGQF